MFKLTVLLLLISISTNFSQVDSLHYIEVPYTLWIGNPVNFSTTITVRAAKNSTFYKVMELASNLNHFYEFEAIESEPYGHFITKIAGVSQNTDLKSYWFLYNVTCKPDISNPPGNKQLSPVGVDSLIVRKHSHYLFWYTTWQD